MEVVLLHALGNFLGLLECGVWTVVLGRGSGVR